MKNWKVLRWLKRKDITFSDLLKICFSMGFLLFFVIIMIIGAVGSSIQ